MRAHVSGTLTRVTLTWTLQIVSFFGARSRLEPNVDAQATKIEKTSVRFLNFQRPCHAQENVFLVGVLLHNLFAGSPLLPAASYFCSELPPS